MIFKNICKTFVFALLLVILFVLLRGAFILYVGVYHQELGAFTWGDLLRGFYNGGMYDNRNIAAFAILYLFLSFLPKNRFLIYYAGFVFSLSIFLGMGNMLFYTIYQEPYDTNLLGLVFDDRGAILATGFSGNYDISIKVIIWLLASFLMIFIYKFCMRRIDASTISLHLFPSLGLFFVLCALLTMMLSSSFGIKIHSLDQQLIPCENPFLRKITTDSYRSLYLVYKGYKIIKNSKMQDFATGDIREILGKYFNLSNEQGQLDIYKLLEQHSHNTSNTKIRHIFYIVAESMSQWFYDSLYDAIHLVSQTKALLKSPHAIYFEPFLENAPSTAKSLETQITGLFQLDIPLQSLLGILPKFQTAIPYAMNQLGYKTAFFYGGSGRWQKLQTLSLLQGFREFFDDKNLENFLHNTKKSYPTPYHNVWGYSDAVLFDFILENTTDAPSFNMIMTTSNHQPFDIPLQSYHVPMEKIQQFVKENQLEIDPKILGHIYYADRILARFIREMSAKYPDSLFVITGDHYGHFSPKDPNLSITKQVPLILYAPTLNMHKTTSVGSHIDISATILELIAPKDFSYASFGKPLASNNPDFKLNNHIALGYFAIATPELIYNPKEHYYYAKNKNPTLLESAKKEYERLDLARAISWYLIFKGSKVD
ncbi:LTA synthase family protein [Helicobacter mustelae]|uniref:Sulfatase N-terminal domain-containing protein n=1 Tax=Helicobacter mustelae (strain ATCC 43772 / CCUG 25715 / CIP 103759 / LMG 18044 / NCTC 12198 / R85-136P) TaxID=679897 RepID=D3UGL4_HELM1|nr:alkaline phosphatase family protein [Helicobacter mustelae]CBG39635.1 Putative hypothetical protein [Helicobacter mustelae 12198]SQH71146.1 phosphatidylglycerol-membrane-oligosaccharide glycerophosphotransferase MdoB [Helicobacter mustelae]